MVPQASSEHRQAVKASHAPESQAIAIAAPHSNAAVYNISGDARVHLGDSYVSSSIDDESVSRQRLLTRLSFPRMYGRSQQIANAFPHTYEWVLQPPRYTHQTWNSLVSWLSSSQPGHGIFWIHGKPGSGKSTLMKFLDSNITASRYTVPWADESTILRARYFFWSAGNALQKSLEGLCRSLLVQLLEQSPAMIDFTTSRCKQIDLHEDKNPSNKSQLCKILAAVIGNLSAGSRFLLLIDGLDECDSSDDEQDEVVDLLVSLSRFETVKVIISSRPENVFKDAFTRCPQLRLEDLTRSDIQVYVISQLEKHRRWLSLKNEEPAGSEDLINDTIERAEGVFLWVVLVVRGIIRDLRDGDNLDQLRQTLHQIPADLDNYFMRIIESIEPSHRREASVLLQLALYEEEHFIRLSPLRLLDTLFIGEPCDNFILRPNFNVQCLDLSRQEAFQAKLDSAFRKVNSRCKGLLQCTGDFDSVFSQPNHYNNSEGIYLDCICRPRRRHHGPCPKAASGFAMDLVKNLFGISVDFLHRSLRDYLLLPPSQAILHSYTDGQPIQARRHLYNARLVQLLALCRIGYWHDLAVPTASGVLSAFAVDNKDIDTAQRALLARDCIEELAVHARPAQERFYYICCSFEEWSTERSNFLTLAIDFNITSYILINMNATSIRKKEGRPILDYVLRPRFREMTEPFYKSVDPQLVRAALACGADPNSYHDGVSIWALYVCYLADYVVAHSTDQLITAPCEQVANLETLQFLINAGAATLLPLSWLSRPVFSTYQHQHQHQHLDLSFQFQKRWNQEIPNDTKRSQRSRPTPESLIPVSSLLQNLHWHHTLNISELMQHLRSREPSTSTNI